MEETSESRLDEIVEILLATIRLIESDFIPVPRQRVPVYLTRYDLYSDAILESSDHRLNAAVLDSLWNEMCVFDIAEQVGADYGAVREYLLKFVEHGLLDTRPLTPQYFRQGPELASDASIS